MRKKEQYPVINWNKVNPGDWFSAEIKGVKVVGKVESAGVSKYLCQNVFNGSSCENKWGFDYSWTIHTGSIICLRNNGVSYLAIYKMKPKTVEPDKIFHVSDGLLCIIRKGYVFFPQDGGIRIENKLVRTVSEQIETAVTYKTLKKIKAIIGCNYKIDCINSTLCIGCKEIDHKKIKELVSLLKD